MVPKSVENLPAWRERVVIEAVDAIAAGEVNTAPQCPAVLDKNAPAVISALIVEIILFALAACPKREHVIDRRSDRSGPSVFATSLPGVI
jgi:hypothetical protein